MRPLCRLLALDYGRPAIDAISFGTFERFTMAPDILSGIAALPWQLQIVLGSGYASYLLASYGLRNAHKATDTLFGSLAFGLLSLLTLVVVPRIYNVGPVALGCLAFFLALVGAVLWRVIFRKGLRRLLRDTNYSWSDDSPSAWNRLLDCDYKGFTQFTVEMTDGRYLYCTEAERVEGKPYGPLVLGESGDVLMYVDRMKKLDGSLEDLPQVFDDEWGDLLTYIPAGQIRKIAIRVT